MVIMVLSVNQENLSLKGNSKHTRELALDMGEEMGDKRFPLPTVVLKQRPSSAVL